MKETDPVSEVLSV